MDMIAEIRRRHLISKESISSIARDLKLSRPTVRKHCRTQSEPIYRRDKQPTPMLGAFQETLETWLRTERLLPKAQRRTARRLFEGLQVEGYRGAYDSVQRFVQRWKAAKSGPALRQAFVPLAFAPGEVCQFDWSHEHVELAGVMQTIKVAHFRLTFSRQMFVVAYPRETQEMVFDAHDRAFTFFGGVGPAHRLSTLPRDQQLPGVVAGLKSVGLAQVSGYCRCGTHPPQPGPERRRQPAASDAIDRSVLCTADAGAFRTGFTRSGERSYA